MSATQSDQPPRPLRQQPFDGATGAGFAAAAATATAQCGPRRSVDAATLQVSGGAAAGKDAKADSKEESHEHPCVCDLQLPRKALSNEERFARAKDWLRGGSGVRGGKSPGSSSERKRDGSSRPAKRVASPRTAAKGKDKDKGKGKGKTASPKKRRPGVEQRDVAQGRAAGPGLGKRTTARSRSRGPRIAVKLNRAATLRMEKGTLYCGKRPIPVDRFQMGRVQGAEEVKKKQRRARPVDANCAYRACRRIR